MARQRSINEEKAQVLRDAADVIVHALSNSDAGNLGHAILAKLADRVEAGEPYDQVIEHALMAHGKRRVAEGTSTQRIFGRARGRIR